MCLSYEANMIARLLLGEKESGKRKEKDKNEF